MTRIFVLALAALLCSASYAADKGGPPAAPLEALAPSLTNASCMVGIHGSYVNGDLDFGSPVNIGSNGTAVGGSGECGLRMGRFYVGGGIDHSRIFGDLKSIGVNADTSLFAKVGAMPSDTSMLYVLLAKSRLDTTVGDIDGWQFGGGALTSSPTAPLYVDIQLRYGTYDVRDVFGPGAEAKTTVGRVGLIYRFGQ